MNKPPPIFVVAGPTGVGKSAFAARLAEAENGEIVSADAFQIYRGMRLLTAAPDPETRSAVPHHLVEIADPAETWDVARWLRKAQEAIEEIRGRGRWPIVCGGTGLFIRAITRGLSALPPADPGLRAKLEAAPLQELQSRLCRVDPEATARIDLRNPRRVIRALEVFELTGRPFTSFHSLAAASSATGVLLLRERQELADRIRLRVGAMFDAGVVEEIEGLHLGPTAAKAIGVAEIGAVLAGTLTRADAVERIATATRQYAKRQLTWFRREPWLEPIDVGDETDAWNHLLKRFRGWRTKS